MRRSMVGLAVVLAACGGEADAPAEGAGGAGGGGPGGDATLLGTVVALEGGAALGGVQLCVHDRADLPCVTSGADGSFALGPLPGRSDWLLALKAEGRVTSLAHVTADGGEVELGALPSADAPSLARWTAASGGAEGGGFVLFRAELLGAGVEGATARLEPEAGTVVYGDDAGAPIEGRGATGGAGRGVIVAAPAGTRRLVVEAGGGACPVRAPNGWSDGNSFEVQVVSGYLTYAGVADCGG